MAYSGTFQPKNRGKYVGNLSNITFRSLWERQVFKWCDTQSFVVKWSSEEVVIPYLCKTDRKPHRYFVDLKITFADGRTFLVEIKPAKETQPPATPKKKGKRYITEVMTYVKNQCKWEAAEEYAKDRNWIFEVWTEDTLKKLGIRVL